MDFFNDYVTFNDKDYVCNYSQHQSKILLPLSNSEYPVISCGDGIFINGYEVKVVDTMVVYTKDFCDGEKLFQLSVSH